jgi:hypothetical protein
MEKTYWCVGSGSYQRSFSDVFFDFGVFATDACTHKDGIGCSHHCHGRRLNAVKKGDVLVLKQGVSKILGVGIVVGEVISEDHFNMSGWNFGVYRKVKWFRPKEQEIPFKNQGLSQGTINRTHKQNIKDEAEKGILEWDPVQIDGQNIKQVFKTQKVSLDKIVGGLKPNSKPNLLAALRDISDLAKDYRKIGDCSEAQVRTFLVVPILIALGWTSRKMKLEYPIQNINNNKNRADVACFDNDYNNDTSEAPKMIVEVKKMSEGLTNAKWQAFKYAKKIGVKLVCVTNGYCYQIYDLNKQIGNPDDPEPNAFINIITPTDKYPLNEETDGAVQSLQLLMKK